MWYRHPKLKVTAVHAGHFPQLEQLKVLTLSRWEIWTRKVCPPIVWVAVNILTPFLTRKADFLYPISDQTKSHFSALIRPQSILRKNHTLFSLIRQNIYPIPNRLENHTPKGWHILVCSFEGVSSAIHLVMHTSKVACCDYKLGRKTRYYDWTSTWWEC